jgi:hypothetical protein
VKRKIRTARRHPQRAVTRLHAKNAELTKTIELLREEFGSLLDLVPLANIADGIDHETMRWLMQGQFLPHIAQLMATTLLAFGAANVCEWTLEGDPRGQFLLTIQRKAGKSALELRAEAEDRATVAEARLHDLATTVRPALDAYAEQTGTLEQLLDALQRGLRAAEAPPGMSQADIIAAVLMRLRKDNRTTIAPELLPFIVGQLLDERRAARTLLDRQDIEIAMIRAPHLRDAYMAYKHMRGISDNHNQDQNESKEDGSAAQAGAGHNRAGRASERDS